MMTEDAAIAALRKRMAQRKRIRGRLAGRFARALRAGYRVVEPGWLSKSITPENREALGWGLDGSGPEQCFLPEYRTPEYLGEHLAARQLFWGSERARVVEARP